MQTSERPLFVPGVWGPYFSAMLPNLYLNEGGQSSTGQLVMIIIIYIMCVYVYILCIFICTCTFLCILSIYYACVHAFRCAKKVRWCMHIIIYCIYNLKSDELQNLCVQTLKYYKNCYTSIIIHTLQQHYIYM